MRLKNEEGIFFGPVGIATEDILYPALLVFITDTERKPVRKPPQAPAFNFYKRFPFTRHKPNQLSAVSVSGGINGHAHCK